MNQPPPTGGTIRSRWPLILSGPTLGLVVFMQAGNCDRQKRFDQHLQRWQGQREQRVQRELPTILIEVPKPQP